MNRIKTTTLSCACTIIILCTPLPFNAAVNTEDIRMGSVTMHAWASESRTPKAIDRQLEKNKKLQLRREKLIIRLDHFIQRKLKHKSIANIHDSTDKWFWIWSISWGLGILLTIFSGAAIAGAALGLIWFFSFAIGATALVLWLKKKFG
ncbi:MAG: hypothetical protein IPL92_09855 [Saprospiraceae bacterium]|nr:hypothetical protein [Candidatus Opimibacter iunctus]